MRQSPPTQTPLPPNRIRELREARGLRAIDLAAHFRLWPSTITRWELGQVTVPDRHKFELARLLEVDVPYLMGWEGQPAREEAA